MSLNVPSQDMPDIIDAQEIDKRLVAEFAAKHISFHNDIISPERIMSIIDASNREGHAIHGVKWRSRVGFVDSQGVAPLTTEGGNVSFWTSGSYIFGTVERERHKVSTYDCPLFNYGHCREEPGTYDSQYSISQIGDEEMCIAITNKSLIEQVLGVKDAIPPEGYIELKFPVPRNAMCLLRVRFVRAEAGRSSVAGGILKERAMVQLIEEALFKGYKGGETKSIEVH